MKPIVANHTIVRFLEGQAVSNPVPGDIVLTHTQGTYASLIRFGQSLRPNLTGFTEFNHAALVVDDKGTIVEALGNGVCYNHVSKYTPKEYVLVRVAASPEQRAAMVRYAVACVGSHYGWTNIISIGLSLITGLALAFGFENQMICSGLVATAVSRGDDVFERNCTNLSPADLAKHYGVTP